VRFPERGGLPGQEGLEGPWAPPSALFWLKKFYPVVNEKLPHRPTASLHRRILGISVFVVRNYLTAIYDEMALATGSNLPCGTGPESKRAVQSCDLSAEELPALGRLRPSLECLFALPGNRETAVGSAPCFQS
jgi:hypothetical protein